MKVKIFISPMIIPDGYKLLFQSQSYTIAQLTRVAHMRRTDAMKQRKIMSEERIL